MRTASLTQSNQVALKNAIQQLNSIENNCFFFCNKEDSKRNLRQIITMDRSSRPEVFYKKGVLRNFTKFTGKHLC